MFGTVAEAIETDRLLLEPLETEHAEEMVEVLGDARLHAFIGGEPAGLEELRARYARLVRGPAPYHQECWLNWIVRRWEDARAVGTVQATVRPGDGGPNAAVAWIVGVPYQGHGYATEAARALARWLYDHGVTALSATVHPDNHASTGVARRLGLHPTREHLDGEVVWRDAPDGR